MPPEQLAGALESLDDMIPDELRTLLTTVALYNGLRDTLQKHAAGERTAQPAELVALQRSLAEHCKALKNPLPFDDLAQLTHELVERVALG